MKPEESKLADALTAGIEKHWSKYNARPYALAAIVSLREAGYDIVPRHATPRMKLAGHQAFEKSTSRPSNIECSEIGYGAFGEIYEAMLAATPDTE